MTDPRPRKDGLCYVCRRPLRIKRRVGLNPALYLDPFCSTVCARRYHGVLISGEKEEAAT